MRMFRSLRLTMMALMLAILPASSYAGVFISVGFAPPALPVYEQPVCPEPGLMWTPGYWAYGPDGYYWVPGAWVPAPYVGALWTPGYWGWGGGAYVWHPGYWGDHVGYYGGVNYGFGYMGIGFAGGIWRGGVFAYNSAVMHVGVGGGWGGNRVYVDRTIVHNTTIVNVNHVSYNGGRGGINHAPTPQENMYAHENHITATSFQAQHESAARGDHTAYFNNNHGRPVNVAVARPLPAENHAAPGMRGNAGFQGRANENVRPGYNGGAEAHGQAQFHNTAPQEHNAAPQYRAAPESHAQPQYHAAPEQHAAPQYRAAPEQRAPQMREEHAAQQPRPEGHGGGGGHEGGHEGGHGHGR